MIDYLCVGLYYYLIPVMDFQFTNAYNSSTGCECERSAVQMSIDMKREYDNDVTKMSQID